MSIGNLLNISSGLYCTKNNSLIRKTHPEHSTYCTNTVFIVYVLNIKVFLSGLYIFIDIQYTVQCTVYTTPNQCKFPRHICLEYLCVYRWAPTPTTVTRCSSSPSRPSTRRTAATPLPWTMT